MPAAGRKDAIGRSGERHARLILEAQGYIHIASNWHCRAGELDLVMTHGDVLVFVEVKTRRGDRAGRAEEAISQAKARRMLAAAEWFVGEHPQFHDHIWRCDLMAITIDERTGTATHRHIENAIVFA